MKRLALAVALAAAPLAALADTVGTYLTSDGQHQQTMTISYKNDQAIRMDVGQGTYMLVTGPKVYTVTNQGGQLTVIDMDSMPKLKGAVAKDINPANSKVTKTGRTETIAGIKGDVYEITYENQKHEAVMSADKRAQALNKAFVAIAKRMGETLGADTAAQINLALEQAKKYGNLGLLRSDRNFVLQSVGDKSLPASHYELPKGAAPMQIPKMPQFDPAQMQQMQQQMLQMQQQMMKQQGK